MGLPASPLAAYGPFPPGIQNGLYKLKSRHCSAESPRWLPLPLECSRGPSGSLPCLASQHRPLWWAGVLSAFLLRSLKLLVFLHDVLASRSLHGHRLASFRSHLKCHFLMPFLDSDFIVLLLFSGIH